MSVPVTSVRSDASDDRDRVDAQDLLQFVAAALRTFDLSQSDAKAVADVLVAADLRGIDSHGVARFERFCVEPLRDGTVDPRAQPVTISETTTTVAIDASNGFGHPASTFATRAAIAKAWRHGFGVATVRRSNHHGATSHYPMMIADAGLVGFAATNTPRLMAPTFGSEPVLGNNPFAIAIPGLGDDRFVLDMATSAVAYGKLEVAANSGRELPEGVALDAEGRPTSDPVAALGGSLIPLGGVGTEHGGHKGFGLSLLIDILTGVFAGGAFGDEIPRVAEMLKTPAAISHTFVAIDASAIRERSAMRRDVSTLLDRVRASAPDPDHEGVHVPGDVLRATESERRANGIPLAETTRASLAHVAAALRLDATFLNGGRSASRGG